MRDEHERGGRAAEKILQPVNRVHVEMIGRFVEQQHVGRRHQRPGQQHPTLHSGREGLEPRGRRQVHVGQNPLELPLGLPGCLMLVADRPQTRGDDFLDRAGNIMRNILRQHRDFDACREANLPGIGVDLAAENSHERRLARPVAPQQRNPLARLDLARYGIQQRRTAKANGKVADRDEGHSPTRGVG